MVKVGGKGTMAADREQALQLEGDERLVRIKRMGKKRV